MSSAEQLSKLKKTRGGHCGSKRIAELKQELIVSSTEFDLVKILQLKLNLENKLAVLDSQILDLLEEEEIAEDIEKVDEYKGLTYAAIIRAEKISTGAPTKRSVSASTVVEYDELIHPEATLIDSADSEPHMTHTTSAEVSRTTVSPTASVSSIDTEHSSGIGHVLPKLTHAKTSVKFPKLTLRPFSGDLTQWFAFWDSFIVAVHNNSQLVDVDKFNYLKSLLSGVALEAVQGLALTDANYKEAVTILQRRFGNRQQIIDKHMDQLLKAESVTSPCNVVGLRRLFDSIESHIRSLNSLGGKG